MQYIVLHNADWPFIELYCKRVILPLFPKVDGNNFGKGVRICVQILAVTLVSQPKNFQMPCLCLPMPFSNHNHVIILVYSLCQLFNSPEEVQYFK